MAVGAAMIVVGVVFAITMQRHGSSLGLLICVPFAAVGVYQILFAKRVTIVVDKSLATVSIAWRTLVGSGDGSVDIADIDRITYREFISDSTYYHKGYRERRTTRKDTSLLVLKSGSAILLDKESTSAFGTTLWLPRSSDREVDWALAGFIGVPLVDNGTSTEPLTASLSGLQPDLAMAAPEPVATPEPLAAPEPPATPAPAPVAPAAPCLAPSSAPAGSPYWCETPPPWAR